MKKSIDEKWEIICKIMKAFDKEYHKIAVHYNLSDSSFWILYALYQNREGCTQKELCTSWYINKQTINSSIKYLKNKEYITLKYEENNKKFKKIYITENGLEVAKQTVGRVMKIENRVFESVDIKELDRTIKFFNNQLITLKKEIENEILGGK